MTFVMNTRKIGAFNLVLFGVVYLFGCDSLRQEVNPDRLNREAAKLVVTCFLSPQDTVLAVKVNRTQPVLGESTNFSNTGINVSDATVTLSESGQSVTLRYDARLGYYQAPTGQLPVAVGRTYALAVQTPVGEQARASCTVPASVALTSVVLDSSTENQFGRQHRRYFVRARWTDPAGQANYYLTTGMYKFLINDPKVPGKEQFSYLSLGENNNNGLLTDRNTDGREMISERLFMNIGYYSNNSQAKISGVSVNLLTTDQAYYQYLDAIDRQSEASGNPFAEPVPIPSNIQGALGCFGAYNHSTLTMTLK